MTLLMPALVQGLQNVSPFSLHSMSQAATAEHYLLHNNEAGDCFDCICTVHNWDVGVKLLASDPDRLDGTSARAAARGIYA